MKDNRKSPFISDLSTSVQTSQGIKKFTTLSYTRFNKFTGDNAVSGSFISDFSSNKPYNIAIGIPSSNGKFNTTDAKLTDFKIYGETVYTDMKLYGNVGLTVPMMQRGISFPLDGNSSSTVTRKFLVNSNCPNLNPSIDGRKLCFMLKVKVGSNHNNQSILMVGEPGTAKTTFSVGLTSTNVLEFKHRTASGTAAVQTVAAGTTPLNEWITLFINTSTTKSGSTIRPTLGAGAIYSTALGNKLLDLSIVNSTDPVVDVTSPNVYVGYGEPNGGVNNNFALTDFLRDVEVAELVVFSGNLTGSEIDLIAKSHLGKNHFKSGLNNRPPSIVQQIFDTKSTYPISSNPAQPKILATAFNDQEAYSYMSGSLSTSNEMMMFPEMIPAKLFSGSNVLAQDPQGPLRGDVRNPRKFFRDVHNTPWDKRLVAPGQPKRGLSHKETRLLNLSSRNSPITTSKDKDFLGGTVAPFDDSNSLVDKITPAVDASVYPDLQQKMSDHIAITIDLSPTSDSTIGVDRNVDGVATGKITSIAYFNFDTKQWETEGKNNEFIVQTPLAVATGSWNGTLRPGQIQRSAEIQSFRVLDDSSVAFAGTSGFSILTDQPLDEPDKVLAPLSQRASPTSNYGFPIHQKYEAKAGQLIDMSKYINAPFLLERVSFEFGAAIEDSGPHSLGYKIPDLDNSSVPGSTQYIDQQVKVSGQPTGLLTSQQVLYPNYVSSTRASFINGSNVRDIETYDRTMAPTDMYMSSSADNLNSIITQNRLGVSATGQYGLRSRPGTIKVEHNSARGTYSGTIFLKTSIGPRGSSYVEPARPQTNTSRLLVGDSSVKGPVSYMPVLAGGVNGVVTGSLPALTALGSYPDASLATSATKGGPHLVLQPNKEHPGMNTWLNPETAADEQDPTGGTPFWRADSFFLLRQSIASRPPIVQQYKLSVGSDLVMFPIAPYQGAMQPYIRTNSNTLKKNIVNSGAPFTPQLQDLADNRIDYGKTAMDARFDEYYSNGKITDGVMTVNSTIPISGSTSREIITFGQMTHYGYVNAADSYVDTLWTDPSAMTYASGSAHNLVFQKQLFKGSGGTGAPRRAVLFGQAMKYAVYPDIGWSIIPANIENIKRVIPKGNANNISMFSDLPDSYQGQFAYLPTAKQGRQWDLEIENDSATRNRTGPLFAARYALSGSQDSDTTSPDGANAPVHPGTAYSLDTYTGNPTVVDYDEVEGWKFADNAIPSKVPAGSGFSVISTPAYLASGTPVINRVPDLVKYGSFRVDKSSPASWLDSGLSRDLNIRLTTGDKHQGVNPDIPDNWCGFTLMTASTCWRPLESPGRESASLPLQANVYKRQYLNYRKDFKIDVPVRSIPPSDVEPGGFWLFTAPDPYVMFYSKETTNTGPNRSYHEPQDRCYYANNYAGTDGTAGIVTNNQSNRTNGQAYQTALSAKRYHRRFSAAIVEGGFTPGPDQKGINSGRMFVGQASAVNQKQVVATRPFSFGASPFYNVSSDVDTAGTVLGIKTPAPPGYNDKPTLQTISYRTQVSGSKGSPTSQANDALYILQPSDKLILGVQPSLPGWNPGSGLPNNRHSKKYGVWDYTASGRDGTAIAGDVDANGFPRPDAEINLEDPYEPSHGLTMLAGPSKIVLYGTFLRNGKHHSNSSTQKLRSSAVHEAVGEPVLDQFMVDAESEYGSSYLSEHITGSILTIQSSPVTGYTRGVAGSVKDGSLTFSGSFQRFVRSAENSQVFYDTLIQDPFQIAEIDEFYTPSGPGSSTVVNMHFPSAKIASSSAAVYDTYSAAGLFTGIGYAFSGTWADSFPFESKYSNVSRLTGRNINNLRANGGLSIGNGAPSQLSGSAPVTLSNQFGEDPGQYIFAPGQSPDGINHLSKLAIEAKIDAAGASNLSLWSSAIGGIKNMANVLNFASDTGTGSVLGAFTSTSRRDVPVKSFRTFFAVFAGYGRQNRKKIDMSPDRYIATWSNAGAGFTASGLAYGIGLHPAGFKYGYMNCDHLSPSTVHRGDTFGQFRDMLEQRLYSKTYSYGDEYNKEGQTSSAVTCIFVDSAGAPVSDATRTTCLNLSTAMTSSKPFIEGEVLREIIFNSESVTVE